MTDIVAMNSFFFVINFINEVVVAGMAVATSVRMRAIAVITNTLTARPYSLWREYLFRHLAPPERRFWANYLIDTLAFFTFQLPLYWTNAILVGKVSLVQLMTASFTIGMMAGLLGRPYGVFLAWARRVARVEELCQ